MPATLAPRRHRRCSPALVAAPRQPRRPCHRHRRSARAARAHRCRRRRHFQRRRRRPHHCRPHQRHHLRSHRHRPRGPTSGPGPRDRPSRPECHAGWMWRPASSSQALNPAVLRCVQPARLQCQPPVPAERARCTWWSVGGGMSTSGRNHTQHSGGTHLFQNISNETCSGTSRSYCRRTRGHVPRIWP